MPVQSLSPNDSNRPDRSEDDYRITVIAGQPTNRLKPATTNPVLPELPTPPELSYPALPAIPPTAPPVQPSAGYQDVPLPEGYSDIADVPTALLAPLTDMGRQEAQVWQWREMAATHMARAKELRTEARATMDGIEEMETALTSTVSRYEVLRGWSNRNQRDQAEYEACMTRLMDGEYRIAKARERWHDVMLLAARHEVVAQRLLADIGKFEALKGAHGALPGRK